MLKAKNKKCSGKKVCGGLNFNSNISCRVFVVPDFVSHLHTNGWYLLDVSVDVQPVVFGGQHDGSVVHQADVEALGMFDFRL